MIRTGKFTKEHDSVKKCKWSYGTCSMHKSEYNLYLNQVLCKYLKGFQSYKLEQ